MRYLVPLGRLFFALIFLAAAPHHFAKDAVDAAAKAGVPSPEILVPLSGVIAIFGGLSVLIGCYARAGAWLLVIFLVPVTLTMHAFWKGDDAMHTQMINFMKNLSMCGGALLIAYFGAGPFSVDAWRRSRPPAMAA
jgi:putative oxidoreductase